MATFGRSLRQGFGAFPRGMGKPPMQQPAPVQGGIPSFATPPAAPAQAGVPNFATQYANSAPVGAGAGFGPTTAPVANQMAGIKSMIGGQPMTGAAVDPGLAPMGGAQQTPLPQSLGQPSGLASAVGAGGAMNMKKGGAVKKYAKGGAVNPAPASKPARSSASSRGDGCAIRGKTKGRFV